MVDNEKDQHDGAKPAGHDVEKAEIECRGLPFASRHRSGLYGNKVHLNAAGMNAIVGAQRDDTLGGLMI